MLNAPSESCAPALRPILERYLAGDISGEIAIVHCVFALGGTDGLIAVLQGLAAETPECAALARIAAENSGGLPQMAAVIAAGPTEPLPRGEEALAILRDRYDRAVAASPEASVALYSLGSTEILARATAEIVARLLEWGLLGTDRRVLDIGCGIGRMERALASQVGAIAAIDISPGMIAEARRRCRGVANVRFRECSGKDLAAFADGGFDLILAVDSFPHLVAAGPAVVECHFADAARLLRPGGAFAILNFSYRGDPDADCRDVAQLAARHGFALRRLGTRDFVLWDGASFLLAR